MNEEDDRNNWEEEEEEVDAIAFVRVRCSKALRARFDATLRNIRCICIRVSRMKKSDSKCEKVKPFSRLGKEMMRRFVSTRRCTFFHRLMSY